MKSLITLCLAFSLLFGLTAMPSSGDDAINIWFPPDWKNKSEQAISIAGALSQHSGLTFSPLIARSYPDILTAFTSNKKNIVYVGSFVQAVIKARGIGKTLVQNMNGKEFYSGVMLYPKGDDPVAILKNYPDQIVYTKGASSGESSAKAATAGRAAISVANHEAAANAVKAGKAKAAVVKNWWWEGNKDKFPMLEVYKIPGVSIEKNADNVLTVSKAVPADVTEKIKTAAIASKDAFGAQEMQPFDESKLDFSLDLMKRGKINPLNNVW